MTPEGNNTLIVLVGKGLIHAIEVPGVPAVGQEITLISNTVPGGRKGRFRVTSVGEMTWAHKVYPHINIERVGDAPENDPGAPCALLTI